MLNTICIEYVHAILFQKSKRHLYYNGVICYIWCTSMHAMDEYWTFDAYPILRLTIRDFVGIDINNDKYCYEIKQSHW